MNNKQIELGNVYKAMIENKDYSVGNYALFSIQEAILKWNLERGNIDFNAVKEVEMFEEEILEYEEANELFQEALTCVDRKPALFEMVDAQCDKYVIFTGTLAKSGMVEAPLMMELKTYYDDYKDIPKKVEELGFDFKKCMIECLTEINSRKQDPEQKARWENGDKVEGEKWQKSELPEHKKLWYKANYSICMIKDCGCA